MPSCTIQFDSGSKPNPGPSAIAYVIETDESTYSDSRHIGESTNIKAEYKALIQALKRAAEHECSHVTAKTDTETIVKQMTGEYGISDDLRPLHRRARNQANEFEHFEIEHVSRDGDSRVDNLIDEVLE